MTKRLLLLLLTFCCSFSLAVSFDMPTLEDFRLKFAVDGGAYWGEQSQTIFLREKLFLSLDYELSPQYEFKNELYLEFSKGSFQYLSNEAGGGPFDVNYSYLSIKNLILENFYLNIGFINQGFLNAPLLLYDRPFAGLQQEYFWMNSFIAKYVDEFRIVLQQTIPSVAIVVDQFDQLRGISNLLTASVFTSSFIQNRIHGRANFTGFLFNNLSAQAAEHGSFNGNEIQSGFRGKFSKFDDPYFGIHTGLGARFNVLPDLGLDIQYNFLWNVGAFINRHFIEDGKGGKESYLEKNGSRSRGDSLSVNFHLPMSIDRLLVFGIEGFRNENNASIAFYSDSKYGGSARYGIILSSQVLFKKYNILLDFNYGTIQSYPDKRALLGGGRNLNYFGFEIRTEYGKV